jgi:nucleoprotein TPR
MASADVLTAGGFDVTRLAAFLAMPDEDVAALASITEDYVASFLQAVVAKANEFDNLKAEKIKIEVELEQCVRTADSRVKSMKGQLDSALAETQELRQKVSNTGLSTFLVCLILYVC